MRDRARRPSSLGWDILRNCTRVQREFGKSAARGLADEIKFVVGTQQDYDWTKQTIAGHKLDTVCPLLISWVHPLLPEQQDKSLKKVPPGQIPISRRELAEKIIADALPVRFQVQTAQNDLAAGAAWRLEIYDLRFTIYDCPQVSNGCVNRKSKIVNS